MENCINFKSFIRYAMKKKKYVFICSVFLFIISVVFVFVLCEVNRNKQIIKIEKELDEYQEAYNAFISLDKGKLELEIEELEEELESNSEYVKQSILLSYNGWFTPCHSRYIILSSANDFEGKQHISRERLFYLIKENISDELEGIGDILDCADNYVEELIEIVYDSKTQIIYINVLYPDKEKMEQILDFVIEKIENIVNKYDYFDEYKINVSDTNYFYINKDTIAKKQNDKITEYKNNYNTYIMKRKQLEEKKEPEMPSVKKVSRKYEVFFSTCIGCLVWFLVWAIYFISVYVYILAKGILISSKACVAASDLFLLGDFTKSENKDEICERISALLSNFVDLDGKIMLLGNYKQKQIEEVNKKMKKYMPTSQFSYGYDINSDAQVLRDVINADIIVCVFKVDYEDYKSVRKQMRILNDFDKKVVGCIVC